jgi:hypothetical protein
MCPHAGLLLFFIMAADHTTCKDHLTKLLEICKDIGVPMSKDKTTEPSNNTTFLGIELDINLRVAKLPSDKIEQYTSDIQDIRHHTKIKKRLLESLIGEIPHNINLTPSDYNTHSFRIGKATDMAKLGCVCANCYAG